MGGGLNIGDRIADWTGAVSLGGAGAFAAFALTPATHYAFAPAIGGVAAAMAMTLIGLATMRQVHVKARAFAFAPAVFEPAEAEEELLLVDQVETASEAQDELLLDDQLETPGEESRVLRLFAPQTMDVPGEMVERIESWLADARQRRGGAANGTASGHGPASSPASASLHAALADIRRSIR